MCTWGGVGGCGGEKRGCAHGDVWRGKEGVLDYITIMKEKKLSFRSSQDLNLGLLYTGGGKSGIWGAHDYKYMVARGVRGHARMRSGDKTI